MPLKVDLFDTKNKLIKYAEITKRNRADELEPLETWEEARRAYNTFKNGRLGRVFFTRGTENQIIKYTITAQYSNGLIRNGPSFTDSNNPIFWVEQPGYDYVAVPGVVHDTAYPLILQVYKYVERI